MAAQWVRAGSFNWSRELSDNYTATICQLQLSMSIATMEEEIVGVSVRLNLLIRQHFQNIVIHSFEFPEAWVDTSRLDHHLLA